MRSVVLALLVCAVTRSAAAQNKAEAERLFDEGLALIEAGKPVEACAKFEESLAKDPRQVGVLMNLGRCNQRAGKIATALRLYREAFDRASEANLKTTRDRAQDEIASLVPKVPIVTLSRATPPLPGEKVVVDDIVIPVDRTEILLDPGTHTIVVTAPGRLPYQTEVTLEISERTKVVLPELEAPKTTVVTRDRSSRALVGKIATFSGIGLALAGTVLIVYAKRDYDQLFEGATPHCGMFPPIDGKPTCDETGLSRSERDRNLVDGGSVIAIVGAAAALTGIVLWATAPGETSSTTIVPTTSAGITGMAVTGRF
ncbi:MAG: tetratricopeptide repeat protein [Deltaproteobacteria bacterium]|nr:tetratricopeptide repeat protein [Deltaproteobacteria bacterium]